MKPEKPVSGLSNNDPKAAPAAHIVPAVKPAMIIPEAPATAPNTAPITAPIPIYAHHPYQIASMLRCCY